MILTMVFIIIKESCWFLFLAEKFFFLHKIRNEATWFYLLWASNTFCISTNVIKVLHKKNQFTVHFFRHKLIGLSLGLPNVSSFGFYNNFTYCYWRHIFYSKHFDKKRFYFWQKSSTIHVLICLTAKLRECSKINVVQLNRNKLEIIRRILYIFFATFVSCI